MSASPVVSFPFSVFVVSATSTKLTHLFMHTASVQWGFFVLYLPSLFIPDFFLICAARLLLRKERGFAAFAGRLLGWLLSLVTFSAASSQLGFFYRTGGEIEWDAAGNMATDEGVQVLLSESFSVLIFGVLILVVSWLLQFALYRLVGAGLVAFGQGCQQAYHQVLYQLYLENACPQDLEGNGGAGTNYPSYEDVNSDSDSSLDDHKVLVQLENKKRSYHEKAVGIGRSKIYFKRKPPYLPAWMMVTAFFIFVSITFSVRPVRPWTHMSTTLPLPLHRIFRHRIDVCAELSRVSQNKWPLPKLIDQSFWEPEHGDFKGWAPGDSKFVRKYRERTPEWLPNRYIPKGFHRWDKSQRHNITVAEVEEKGKGVHVGLKKKGKKRRPINCPNLVVQDDDYNPVDDPMRITNLDMDFIQPLRQSLKENPAKITHVAFILMESLREELFPIQQGSEIHKIVMNSHRDDKDKFNERLSQLTPNAERITGKLGGFTNLAGEPYEPAAAGWTGEMDTGMGGINVVGAFTPSSVSVKSIVASHCGVWPLPVDFLEEAETQSYQPCLPQIFELFNRQKGKDTDTQDYHNRKWNTAFFQSVTDHYDRQDIMDEKIGLKHVFNKKTLKKDSRKDKSIQQIGYFGYPEYHLKHYMEDFITKSTERNERIFFSHFTSTTHHPWETPDWWNGTNYMGRGSRHKDFDKYLGTIRYHDAWLGELLQMFEDKGIRNETLFVFVGDHGQAFKEDTSVVGTYENGHVSNFRVPITFHHPQLPRVQYEANATSLSIVPTILDLLVNTGSLDESDKRIASDLVHEYEGQSLIRPYKTFHNGRRAWNFGVVNSGGGILTVTSADAPWRLILPLAKSVAYTFTDLANDPLELSPLERWSMDALVQDVSKEFGAEAAIWVDEAELVATWWVDERKRLWKYAPTT